MRKTTVIAVLLVSVVVIVAITVAVVLSVKSSPSDKNTDDDGRIIKALPQEPPYTSFAKAAVATDSGPCSEVGRDILRNGGSTADSAIASMFCVGLINMHSTGIGGGGFMVYYDSKSHSATAYDFREEAPAKATEQMYIDNPDPDASLIGGLAVAVPAEVKGMLTVHNDHGKLPWKSLIAPTIKLAKEGFQIMKPVHQAMQLHEEQIKNDPGLRKLLMFNGELRKLGEVITNPELAKTLEMIADDPESFYTGELAELVVKDIQDKGGIVSLNDLKNYTCKKKTAIKKTLGGGMNVFTTPPPSSGVVLSLILDILQNAPALKMGLNDTLIYHRIAEAFKFGYARRALLGDPDFVDLTSVIANMTSSQEAKKLYDMIWNNQTHLNTSYYGGYYAKSDSGTSHLSILGPDGNAVSVTSTINYRFGARFRSLKTGIIYNDQMDDFSTPNKTNIYGVEPSKNNFIKPGARPLSSISPIVVTDSTGKVRFVAGASGGSRITTGTSLVAMNRLWYNMDVQDAVKHPRIHHQLLPMQIFIEKGDYKLKDSTVKGLERLGHTVKESSSFCVVQAIGVDNNGGKIWAKSDPRKHGWAAGY